MKMRFGLISVICGVALSASAFAAGWGTEQTITEVRVYEDGAVLLDGLGGWRDFDGCLNGGAFAVIDPNHAFFSEMYATAMSAYLQGKAIKPYLSGCYTTTDGKDYVSVTRLIVR